MIEIDVRGLREVQQAITGLSRQVPYMTSRALNNTAFKVRVEEQAEMRAVFDRPTPYVMRSVFVQKATPQNLSAQVGHTEQKGAMLNRWSQTLLPHIQGGSRMVKGTEARLRAKGILPSGWFVVPASGMPLNQYGNPKASEFSKLLSYLSAYTDERTERLNRSRTRSRATSQYFSVSPGSTLARRFKPGVYRKTGASGQVPVLIFRSRVQYRKRLDWEKVAERTVNREFEREMRVQVDRELERRR